MNKYTIPDYTLIRTQTYYFHIPQVQFIVVLVNDMIVALLIMSSLQSMIIHLTIHYRGSVDSSWSHSIHSPHCNIVGYSWFTRHCVATNRRAQLYLHCAVITGIIGHNIVKDWEIFYQWWRLKLSKENSPMHTLHIN